jgi:glycosyltransferase involved in cell wall biosynthesis
MRLLVSCIPWDKGKSGISVYTREVVKALAGQGHQLTLVVEPELRERSALAAPLAECQLRERGALAAPLFESGGARTLAGVAPESGGARTLAAHTAPRWAASPVRSMFWHLFCLPFWIWRHRREYDGFVICAANRRACAFYPLPTTATVHDLANFHIPGKYSRSRMVYLAHVLPFFAKRAQYLVAISEATKADMVKFWHCKPEDITVLYDGLTEGTGNGEQGTGNGERGIGNGERGTGNSGGARTLAAHILYISRIEHPGKNHVRLIEAYGRLPRALAEAHPLVLAGADWKDADAVHEAAARSPHSDLIRFTGFVPNEEIESLWAQTGFYVFPSLFEGFGLSLAEAMARGIPCACSNNGSLGEIGEGVAITFDPENVDSIAAALEELLTEDDAARAARIGRGRERAARFSWPDHAAGIARLIEKGI